MPLADIVAEIMAEVEGLTPALAGKWALSTRELAKLSDTPRVIWVPVSDAFGPARRSDPDVRSLATAQSSVRVVVWADTVGDVETIREQLISATHHATAGSYALAGGEWGERQGATTKGELYVLALAFHIPQRELPLPTTVNINAVAPDTYGSSPTDGNLDVGES